MDNFPGKQSQFNDLKQASSNARRKQCLYGRGCSTLDWPTIFAELIKFLFSLVSDPSTERVIFIWEGLHLEQKKCAFCPPFTKHRCYCTVSTSSFHEVHSGLNAAIVTWLGQFLCSVSITRSREKQQNTKEQNGLHPSPFPRIPLALGFSGSLIRQSRRQTTSSALQGPQGFPQSHVSHCLQCEALRDAVPQQKVKQRPRVLQEAEVRARRARQACAGGGSERPCGMEPPLGTPRG